MCFCKGVILGHWVSCKGKHNPKKCYFYFYCHEYGNYYKFEAVKFRETLQLCYRLTHNRLIIC